MLNRAKFAFLTLFCGLAASGAKAMDKTAVDRVAAKTAKGDAIIVDVREADEIKDGMASPAIWIATSEIKSRSSRYKDIMKALPKDKQIYVYCASGVRSGRFVDDLTKSGYKAENLGAYSDWRDAGKSVKPVPDATAKPCPFLCKPTAG